MSLLSDQTERFARRVLLYSGCCNRIEAAFSDKRLRVTDVELVYTSSFLAVCSQWESLLGEVIFEAVTGRKSRKSENHRFASFETRGHLEDLLLFPDKDYISIPTFKRAQQLAALFIEDGMPIAAVAEQNRTFLQQAVWIRNAIAHQSAFAMEQFRTKVPGVTALHHSKRSPGAFLRHEFRVSPSQRRVALYFAAFQAAAAQIASAW